MNELVGPIGVLPRTDWPLPPQGAVLDEGLPPVLLPLRPFPFGLFRRLPAGLGKMAAHAVARPRPPDGARLGGGRTFLEEPRGTINVDGREIPVRAVQTRSERLKKAVDQAYLNKYNTPGSIKYAQDLGRAKSRATTTELVPWE